MKKGFTLIEMIAVIIILAIICILSIPPILSSIRNSKNDISNAMKEVVYSASSLYMGSNHKDYPLTDGNVYCITLKTLVEQDYLESPIVDPTTKNEVDQNRFVQVDIRNGRYTYQIVDSCDPIYETLAVTGYATSQNHETEFLGKKINKYNFETIAIVADNTVPLDAIDSWDVSHHQNGNIMAWYLDKDNNGKYELYIGQKGGVVANPNSHSLFEGFANVTTIDLSNLDTSKVTDMSNMFVGMYSLTELDLSPLDTSNVTNMSYMLSLGVYDNSTHISNLDVSTLDTSKVTNMSGMFRAINNISSLDLSNFDTSKVTDMSEMFLGMSNLTNLNISSFDTSNVTNISSMFFNARSLANLDLSHFNTSKVTDLSYMFYGTRSLTNVTLSSFNTSNVTDMRGMFYYASSLVDLNLSNFNTSKVTSTMLMFRDTNSLQTLHLDNAIFTSVRSYSTMFEGTTVSTIYVKDNAAKMFINNRLSEAGKTATVTIST